VKVNLSELEEVFRKILLHLRQSDLEQIDLPMDYYWNIPEEWVYNMQVIPSDLEVGQVHEEWRSLLKLLKDEEAVTSYHLVWLAAVLRALGNNLSS
jgi:hypothetical protein